jgi:hypothetical protein
MVLVLAEVGSGLGTEPLGVGAGGDARQVDLDLSLTSSTKSV